VHTFFPKNDKEKMPMHCAWKVAGNGF
jgi:hypothetical protein